MQDEASKLTGPEPSTSSQASSQPADAERRAGSCREPPQNGENRLNALTLMQTDICVTESLRNNTTGRVCLQRPRQAFGSGAGASEASEYFLCNVSLYSAPRSQFDIMRQVGQCRTATLQTTRTTHPLRCPTAVPRKHSADCRCLDLPDSKATMR